jgi:DNA-directed RNA polymerase subunit K/omega
MDVREMREYESLAAQVGGKFKLASLLQKRMAELMFGAPPLVENPTKDLFETALRELSGGKITLADASENIQPSVIIPRRRRMDPDRDD